MNKPAKRGARAEVDGQSLLSLILTVAGRLEDRLEAKLASQGLSMAKANTLQCLAEASDPMALSALAEGNACVRSNITQLVDRLETDGLVRRVNDPDDRRVRRAALTISGRKACQAAHGVVSHQESEVARAFTRDEAATLGELLRRLNS